MTSYFAGLLAFWAAWGAVFGAVLVPKLSDLMLRRAYGRSYSWWMESYGELQGYQRLHPDKLPSPSDAGGDGSIGIWLADALAAARGGVLARERAQLLADAGLDVDPSLAKRSERDQVARCSFQPSVLQRVGLGLVGAVAFGILPASGMPLQLTVPLAGCIVAMLCGIACDLRARMIPLESCAALASFGLVFQLLRGGLPALGSGVVAVAVVLIVCWIARHLFGQNARSVGGGDMRCMVALSLATGPGALMGALACYVAASAFSIVGLASRRLGRCDGIPMAPFLALWLVFGGMVTV